MDNPLVYKIALIVNDYYVGNSNIALTILFCKVANIISVQDSLARSHNGFCGHWLNLVP